MAKLHPDTNACVPEFLEVNRSKLEILRKGVGRPILFLHPAIGLDPELPVLDRLADFGEVIAPSHPGFGRSEKPRYVTSVDDIAYTYLDLLDQLGLQDVLIVGVSLGGWIAAAIAIRNCARISQVVLADPFGIKLGGPEDADIANMFMLPAEEFDQLVYADPRNAPGDWGNKDAELVRIAARNREMTMQIGWLPYMYDPKLRYWLHRIRTPALFLWGEGDRVVSQSYVRQYSELVPQSSFRTIKGAGHYPHIEQPEAFAHAIRDFAEAKQLITSNIILP